MSLLSETHSVVWTPVSTAAGMAGWAPVRFLSSLFSGSDRPRTFAEALEDQGLPSIPNTTPEQELQILLRYAAEVEHGLMAQYLYGCFASRHPGIASRMRTIAVEEMGHLLTVQNLLLGSAAPAHLARYDWNASMPFAPFPFRLEPPSRLSIAKYATAEMPDDKSIDAEDKRTAAALGDELKTNAPALKIFRVGLLYAKIYWLLRESDAPLYDPELEPWVCFPVTAVAKVFPGRHVGRFPAAGVAQARSEHWTRNMPSLIAEAAESRQKALEAVAKISAQGEGFAAQAQGNDAHFDSFLRCFEASAESAPIAHPAPVNPSLAPVGSDDEITSVDGRAFAKVADQFYELILLTISGYFAALAADDANGLPVFAGASLDLMTPSLALLGRTLMEIERREGGTSSAACAAAGFQRPDADVPNTTVLVLERIDAVSADALSACRTLAASAATGARRDAAAGLCIALEDLRTMFQLPI